MGQWETGTTPRLDHLERAAEVLGVCRRASSHPDALARASTPSRRTSAACVPPPSRSARGDRLHLPGFSGGEVDANAVPAHPAAAARILREHRRLGRGPWFRSCCCPRRSGGGAPGRSAGTRMAAGKIRVEFRLGSGIGASGGPGPGDLIGLPGENLVCVSRFVTAHRLRERDLRHELGAQAVTGSPRPSGAPSGAVPVRRHRDHTAAGLIRHGGRGRLIDPVGQPVGRIVGVVLDIRTSQPTWVTVDCPLCSAVGVVVPLARARLLDGCVQVSHTAADVCGAPRHDRVGGGLDRRREEELR
jgi:hypothetical protein